MAEITVVYYVKNNNSELWQKKQLGIMATITVVHYGNNNNGALWQHKYL